MNSRSAQPVLLGLLAALLEAVFLVLRGLDPLAENLAWVVAAGLAASLLYLLAAFLVLRWQESTPAALTVVLLAAVVFRATLFPLPPTLSDDFHRYLWEGEIQLAGRNPYLATPADPELVALRPGVYDRLPGRDVPTSYGPLTELLFRLAAQLDGPRAFKALSLLFDLGTLLVVVALLRARALPPVRALLYGWCPLVVLEFAASGHNDSMALFTLLLALLWLPRQRGLSAAALAAAMMSKWFAGVAAPVFLRRAGWRSLSVFAGTALLLCLPYLSVGGNLFAGLLNYAAHWRNNASLYALFAGLTGQDVIASGVALGVVAGLALHLTWQGAEPLRASFLLLATVLLLSPSVFPWYVTWLAPFLCFFPNPGFLLWSATALLSYHVLIDFTTCGVWQYSTWLVWLEYVPVYALLLWSGLRRQRRKIE